VTIAAEILRGKKLPTHDNSYFINGCIDYPICGKLVACYVIRKILSLQQGISDLGNHPFKLLGLQLLMTGKLK